MKLLKTQGLQFEEQKMFNQCNRQLQNCQTRSWRVQLVGWIFVGYSAAGDPIEFRTCLVLVGSLSLFVIVSKEQKVSPTLSTKPLH